MSTRRLSRLQADGLLLLAALIWGSAFVGQALGAQHLGPLTFTGLRFLLGALVVLPLAWHEHAARPPTRPRAGALGAMFGLGLLLTAGVVMQQVALQTTSVTNAGFLTALYVPLVPLIGWLLQRQAPHWSVWPAAVGCLVGTWLMTGASVVLPGPGDLWVIASALPWALHVLWVGHVANRLQGGYGVAFGQFLVCGALSTVAGLIVEPLDWERLRAAAGAIAYTGIVSVGIGFTAQVLGQRDAQPADAAILLSSETVFAALFGALLLGERPGSLGLAGAALILASILAVQLLPLLQRQLGPRLSRPTGSTTSSPDGRPAPQASRPEAP